MVMWVTPSLAVASDREALEPPFNINEVDRAVEWIHSGFDAYVDSEETAKVVLSKLGLTEAEINDRFRFARTGEVG
jgi:hypothetical protein